MSFRLIDWLQMKAIPVAQSCRVLGVSRSGFYEAKRRAGEPALCKATVHVRAAFAASHQSYGSRRLITALANRGVSVGRFKVCRLMR
jgi:putative transposase